MRFTGNLWTVSYGGSSIALTRWSNDAYVRELNIIYKSKAFLKLFNLNVTLGVF